MGKTIKVQYNHIIKFTLPFSAKVGDLHKKVRKRLGKLKDKTFNIEYEDTNSDRLKILSNQDLKACIDESVLKETTVIRMFVKLIP